MVVHFPVPVLAVAADAVRDLEGRDALSGLWTLFTKCKESLQDGRRLENISWRLWYRELMLLEEERNLKLFNSSSLGDCDHTLPDEKENEKDTIDREDNIGILDGKIAYRAPSPSPGPTPSTEEPIPPPYSAEDSVAAVGGDDTHTLAYVHEQSPRLRAASSTSPSPSPPPPPQPSVSPLPSSPAPAPPFSSSSPLLSPSSSEYTRRPSSSSSVSPPSASRHPQTHTQRRNSTQPQSRRNSFVNGIGKIIAEMLPGSASASGSSSSLSVTSLNSTSLSSLEAGAGKGGVNGGLGAALFLPGPVLTRQSTSSSIVSRSSSDSGSSGSSSSEGLSLSEGGDAEPSNSSNDVDKVSVSPATQLKYDPTMRMTRISPAAAAAAVGVAPSSPASPPSLEGAATTVTGRPRRCSIPEPAPPQALENQAQAQNLAQGENTLNHNYAPSCLPTPDMETDEPGLAVLRVSRLDMNTTATSISASTTTSSSTASSSNSSSGSGSSSSTVSAITPSYPLSLTLNGNSSGDSRFNSGATAATVAISPLSASDSDSAYPYSLSLSPSISTTTTTTSAATAGNNPDAYPPPEAQQPPQHTLQLQPPLQLQPAYTGPPSPSFSDGYIQAHPGEAEVRELGLLPSLSSINTLDMDGASQLRVDRDAAPGSQLLTLSSLVASTATPPSTSSLQIPIMNAPQTSSSTNQPEPPKLIVVNPTPNPTPHPTPPATPLLGGTIGPGGVIKTQYLALPPGAVGSAAGMRQRDLLLEAQRQMEEMRRAGTVRAEGLRLPLAHAGVGVATITEGTDSAIDRSRSNVPTTGSGLGPMNSARPARVAAEEAAAGVIPSAAGSAGEGGGDRGEFVDRAGRDAGRVAAGEEASWAVSSRAGGGGGGGGDLAAEFQSHSAAGDRQLERDGRGQGRSASTAAARSSATSLLPPLRTQVEGEREDAARRRMGNRHSVSSTTTASSSRSHISSTESATSANTTLFSSEAELVQHPEQHEKISPNLNLNSNYKPLGSLSTIQSLATLNDTDKEKLPITSMETAATDTKTKTGVVKEIFDSTSYDIISNEEALDDEDRSPLSPLPPPGLLAMSTSMSPRSEKRKKRNSAPPPPTTSAALLALSPASTSSASGQPPSPRNNLAASHSSSNSNSHHHHPTRKVITAGGGALTRRASSGRSTSRSRSTGGSSVGKSRSRSREPGVALGAFGMTSAVHPAPTAAVAAAATTKRSTIAHAPHITAGRGRSKVVLSRAAASSKARVALRRNSSGFNGGGGTAAHATAEALEQELHHERQEREEREKTEKLRAEALEKERQRSLESLEDKRRVEAENARAMRAREEMEERMRMQAEQRRLDAQAAVQHQLDGAVVGSTSKRQLKFNIGSNSDQGSGGDSKSAESASDLSGGRRRGSGGRGVASGEERRVVEPQSKGKGKEKEKQRETEEEMARRLENQLQFVFQQQQQQQQQQQRPPHHLNHPDRHDHQDRDQETLQQHLRRQMSKQQLQLLQKMQALHMQQHHNEPTTGIQPHQQLQQRQPVVRHQHQREQEGLLAQELAQGLQQVQLDKASSQQVAHGGGHGHAPALSSRKGKGKEREVVVLSPRHSKSSSKAAHAHAHNHNAAAAPGAAGGGPLDDDLATKIKQSLADPLLPQNKRTIVLTTSESDYETDSEDDDDDDDDGSWSSEEMGNGDGDGDEGAEPRAREEQLRQQELQRQYEQQLLQRQRQQQQQQHQPPPPAARPGAVQRTQSSHYPAPNARGGGRQQRHSQANANAQAMMEKAAREVQRQREMFVKLPTSSLQDLAKARTQSVGLLTQLMHPPPEIFPPDHPYRRGASSGDINRMGMGGGRGASAGGPMRSGVAAALGPLTPAVAPRGAAAVAAAPAPVDEGRQTQVQPQPPQVQAHPPPPPPTHQRRNTEGDGQQPLAKRPSDGPAGPGPARTTFSPPSRALGLQRTKSAAAMPLSSQVLAGSVSTKAPAPPLIDLSAANVNVSVNAKANAAGHSHANVHAHAHPHAHGLSSAGGYRLKGPPEGAELEEESGDEADSGIQISKSVVQEKLKALAQRQGILPANGSAQRPAGGAAGGAAPRTSQPAAHGDDDDVPQWARVSQPPRDPHLLTRSQSQGQTQNRRVQSQNHNGLQQQLTQIGDAASANSNTNNNMLQQQHQHQHANAAPIPLGYPYNLPLAAQPSTPRTTRRQMLSTELPESLRRNLLWERQVTKASGFRRSASGGGSRNSVLGGLRPLTAVPSMVQLHAKGTGPPPANGDGRQTGQAAPGNSDEREQEEERRKAMARNKSWANDYHYSGW